MEKQRKAACEAYTSASDGLSEMGLASWNDDAGDRQGEEHYTEDDGDSEKGFLNTTTGSENTTGIRTS